MRVLALLLFPLLAAAGPGDPPPTPPSAAEAIPGPAGRYRLTGSPDTASELRLYPDGQFEYFLIAGALDSWAAGRWRSEGSRIFLRTEPAPVPPVFSPLPTERQGRGGFRIQVLGPTDRGMAMIDVRVGLSDGILLEGYTQSDGWSSDRRRGADPIWAELSIPMHGIGPVRFPIHAGSGNVFRFRFTPNDIGVVDFRDAAFDRLPDALSPEGYPEIRYVREE